MKTIICEDCGQSAPGYDIVHYGSQEEGFQILCTQCFNTAVALRSGVENFENIKLEPIGITDCAGELHQFHFRTRLLGNMVTIDGFELVDGNPDGYTFQIIGDPEDDLFVLLGKLVQKIRKTLSIKYLEEHEQHGLQMSLRRMRKRPRQKCWFASARMILLFRQNNAVHSRKKCVLLGLTGK